MKKLNQKLVQAKRDEILVEFSVVELKRKL